MSSRKRVQRIEAQRAGRAAETYGTPESREPDRVVDIGGVLLPAYPNHPLRCAARSAGTVDREADDDQVDAWVNALGVPPSGRGPRWREEWENAYSRGWHPLAHIHPDDRPPHEVCGDFYGSLQAWLGLTLPFLTLEACRVTAARTARGRRLRVPGNGELWPVAL